MMCTIDLDATNWTKVSDFYDVINIALGAPKWAGYSIDALLDSIIWGGMNEMDPPYTIRIQKTKNLTKDVLDEIELLKQCLLEARAESITRRGRDVDVNIVIVP
jgi:hypothetical protein